jgi:glycosyltransferase-like protein
MSLRIALLTYATKPRGSVVHTLELATALQQLGHRPTVFALDKEGEGFNRWLPFKTHLVPAAPCLGGIDQLIHQRMGEFVSFFEQHPETYDIYHAQDCLSANALAWLRDQGRIPHFVRTVHHLENFQSPYLQACQERSITQPDYCLCVSQVWQAALNQQYGIEAHRVVNGVNRDRFSPQPTGAEASLAKALGLGSGPVYLTVGGIEPRKNSINLLKAFLQVHRQHPSAQLVIAGGATLFDYQDYRQQFFAIAPPSLLNHTILLPGVITDEDLPTLYRLADAFVFPSLQEGWGLVVLEALASGLPVLTTNQPPFTEFLTLETAYLVNPHSLEELTNSMLEMIQSRNAAPPYKTTQSILDQYTWQASAQLHLPLYQKLHFRAS